MPADSGPPVCDLGIDLGTSSAKAVVVGADGAVLAQASAGYAVTSAVAGYAESEPREWWSAVTACVREAVAAAGARPSAIGMLAPLLPSAGALAGTLTPEAGTELGLPAGLPVAAGAGDTAAAALGIVSALGASHTWAGHTSAGHPSAGQTPGKTA